MNRTTSIVRAFDAVAFACALRRAGFGAVAVHCVDGSHIVDVRAGDGSPFCFLYTAFAVRALAPAGVAVSVLRGAGGHGDPHPLLIVHVDADNRPLFFYPGAVAWMDYMTMNDREYRSFVDVLPAAMTKGRQ